MIFQFIETLLDILKEYFVFLSSNVHHFSAGTTMFKVVHSDFASMDMLWSKFKPHFQFLPNYEVTRRYA